MTESIHSLLKPGEVLMKCRDDQTEWKPATIDQYIREMRHGHSPNECGYTFEQLKHDIGVMQADPKASFSPSPYYDFKIVRA